MYHLEYVLAVAEERNLTRAAQKLFITQPTLTKYLNRLEQDLGVRLFDRSVQPIRITRAGQVYIEDMQKLQSREMNLRSKLRALERDGGSFNIGIQTIRAEYVLPEVLPSFLTLHPHVSIGTDSRVESLMEAAVLAGELDVAVGALTLAYDELEYLPYRADEILLLISRKHPAVQGLSPQEGTVSNPVQLDRSSLREERVLLPRSGGGQYRAAMLMLERHGIEYESTVQCNSTHALFRLAASGNGILFTTPEDFCRHFPEDAGKLAFCRLQQESLFQRSFICWQKDRGEEPLIRDFKVCLLQSIQASLHTSHITEA